ncbi:MAG: T9SS type A sorting domain-containing protein [Bacteroidetes bacterium]|nr:T9SS type A sorting domain-containing protein [Bacteroidota bacterium]
MSILRFAELYPLLYSRLSLPQYSRIPKRATTTYTDQTFPTKIDVWPNYPNPFRDVTSFTFKLGGDMHVRLAVYGAMGREIAVVTDADYNRGVHSVVLRSCGLPSGLYFYRLTTDRGVGRFPCGYRCHRQHFVMPSRPGCEADRPYRGTPVMPSRPGCEADRPYRGTPSIRAALWAPLLGMTSCNEGGLAAQRAVSRHSRHAE